MLSKAINTHNDLSRLRAKLDDISIALDADNTQTARRHLYDARVMVTAMISGGSRPDFVVKATDRHAPATILFWVSQAYEGDVDIEKRRRAMQHYERVCDWQAANPEQVKNPD